MSIEVLIEDIKINHELYPRDSVDQSQVNLYRQNLDELPPIILTKKDYTLIDGFHRLQAHETEGRKTISVELRDIPKEKILIEAIRLNSRHGKQLTLPEKKKLARLLFKEDPNNGKELPKLLAVSSRSIREWTKEIRKDFKEEQTNRLLELYLLCKTQKEISEALDIPQNTISVSLTKIKNGILSEIDNKKPDSLHLYDTWVFKSPEPAFGTDGFPGRIPGQILENFLYYWTNPFDTVVDPMAGGGTTGDVCKAMYRRYQMYDLRPLKTRSDIIQHEITQGYPDKTKNCHAIFLDPPYWNMKDKQYEKGSSSSLSRTKFLDFIAKLAEDSFQTLKSEGVLGFLFRDAMPYFKGIYLERPGGDNEPIFSSDLFQFFINAGFKRVAHISVPLSTQQYTGKKVILAKENKVILNVHRDFYIFRKR